MVPVVGCSNDSDAPSSGGLKSLASGGDFNVLLMCNLSLLSVCQMRYTLS